MSLKYLTPASLGRMSVKIGPMCTSLVSALFGLALMSYQHPMVPLSTVPTACLPPLLMIVVVHMLLLWVQLGRGGCIP